MNREQALEAFWAAYNENPYADALVEMWNSIPAEEASAEASEEPDNA